MALEVDRNVNRLRSCSRGCRHRRKATPAVGLLQPTSWRHLDRPTSYEHTFDRAGDYFFNDCTDPRPVGKIEVYLDPVDLQGALSFPSSKLQFRAGTGQFTGVNGTATAFLDIPAGYSYDGDAQLQTPLSQTPVTPTKVHQAGKKLVVQFDKAALDNNVPEGEVELTLSANFIHQGVQRQLTSTANVTVIK